MSGVLFQRLRAARCYYCRWRLKTRVLMTKLQFVSLEGGLFTLGLPDTYLALNDPGAQVGTGLWRLWVLTGALLKLLLNAGVGVGTHCREVALV